MAVLTVYFLIDCAGGGPSLRYGLPAGRSKMSQLAYASRYPLKFE